jgi:hypothetical protein
MSDQDFKPSRAKSSNYEEIMQTYQTASKSCKLRLTGKENREIDVVWEHWIVEIVLEWSKLTLVLNINLGCKEQQRGVWNWAPCERWNLS